MKANSSTKPRSASSADTSLADLADLRDDVKELDNITKKRLKILKNNNNDKLNISPKHEEPVKFKVTEINYQNKETKSNIVKEARFSLQLPSKSENNSANLEMSKAVEPAKLFHALNNLNEAKTKAKSKFKITETKAKTAHSTPQDNNTPQLSPRRTEGEKDLKTYYKKTEDKLESDHHNKTPKYSKHKKHDENEISDIHKAILSPRLPILKSKKSDNENIKIIKESLKQLEENHKILRDEIELNDIASKNKLYYIDQRIKNIESKQNDNIAKVDAILGMIIELIYNQKTNHEQSSNMLELFELIKEQYQIPKELIDRIKEIQEQQASSMDLIKILFKEKFPEMIRDKSFDIAEDLVAENGNIYSIRREGSQVLGQSADTTKEVDEGLFAGY